ncbi:hypothetical protein ACFWN1_02265 [Streptomyces sp. NPDC058459]|uniref:hypothetical protein n=1 Tax=Streptomyces sp. NPDC058459 TaxID=3346508 RepID=UPI00365B831C
MSRRSVRAVLLSAAVAGPLFLGATGCGGDEDRASPDYKVVAGTQLCGGHAISVDAAKALKVITGSSRFEASGKGYTVAKASTDFVEALWNPTVYRGDACRIYTPRDSPDFDLRITWTRIDTVSTGTPDPKFTVLKMGERAVTAADMAYIQFACTSDELAGSSGATHIEIGVEHWAVSKDPQDNIKGLKDAYATVAHSFSLAMAKELRCEKNGGLPAKPVLDPA